MKLGQGGTGSSWASVRQIPRARVKQDCRQHQPDQRSAPDQIRRIEAAKIEHLERQQRRDREDAETHNERVEDGDIAAGSRAARNSITLSMSITPPISFSNASSKVETSDSGGCMNTRRISGLPLRIMNTLPTAISADITRNPNDSER